MLEVVGGLHQLVVVEVLLIAHQDGTNVVSWLFEVDVEHEGAAIRVILRFGSVAEVFDVELVHLFSHSLGANEVDLLSTLSKSLLLEEIGSNSSRVDKGILKNIAVCYAFELVSTLFSL